MRIFERSQVLIGVSKEGRVIRRLRRLTQIRKVDDGGWFCGVVGGRIGKVLG